MKEELLRDKDAELSGLGISQAKDLPNKLKDIDFDIVYRATQWSLEVLLAGKTFKDVIKAPFKWQPYWEYNF